MANSSAMRVVIKSESELARMRAVGEIVRGVLDAVQAACVPGATTQELERVAAKELARAKATSAFLGYRMAGASPYPAVLCTSVNEVVVHGIPKASEVLREGDVLGIDFACFKDGFCTDSARTLAIGAVKPEVQALIDATRDSLNLAVALCGPGVRIGDLGAAIQSLAEELGYGLVRDFVGHGVGRQMHEDPQIPNYGVAGQGHRLKPGMTIAIEPMFNLGGGAVKVLNDRWTVVTADGSLSAHFEHTIEITEHGAQVISA